MTKRSLTTGDLDDVLTRCGVDPADVVTRAELSEGMYSTVYRVHTAVAKYILKIAPDPGSPRMTYEQNLMSTEVMFYQEAKSVAVPEVVHAGPDFLLMTEIPGRPWHWHKPDDAVRARLRRSLGTLVAELHQVAGTGYGYPQLGLWPTWDAAFRSMVDAVLHDAERYQVQLPVPAHVIRVLLDHPAFDSVDQPVLVHFDLWDGNILLADNEISGLIDGERAFWGDPLAEMASLALFADIEQDAAFVNGYRDAGGLLCFDDTTRFRLAAYRVYLYLIMLVETVPRGQRNAAVVKFVERHLVDNMTMLAG